MRALTEREQKLVNLIRSYERAIENRRNTFTVSVGPTAIEIMRKGVEAGCFAFRHVEKTKDGKTIDVTFDIHHFEMYLHWMLTQAGMALTQDYRLYLPDGHSVPLA